MTNLVPPVTATEISKLAGVTRATVSNWRKRHEDFPKPIGGTDSRPVFDWNAVQTWLTGRGTSPDESASSQLATALRAGLSSRDAQELLVALAPAGSGWAAPKSADRAEIVRRMTAVAEVEGPRAALLALADHANGGDRDPLRYRTPDYVADLMADLLEPLRPAGVYRVLDPACGSGSLLVAAADRGATELYGQDVAETQAALAGLVVNAETGLDTTIAVGDSLQDDAFPGLQVDAVLSSPMSDRDWGAEQLRLDDARWAHGLPSRQDSELAWVQHALSHTRPGGLAVLLLPTGVGSRQSGRRIRASLVRSGALRAVIGLPPRLPEFAWTRVSLQVWVLQPPDPELPIPDSVLLIDTASLAGDTTQSGIGEAVDWSAMVSTVRRSWTAFNDGRSEDAEVPGVATVARAVDLLDDEVDLNPGPRVRMAIDSQTVADDTDSALARLNSAVVSLANAAEVVGGVVPAEGGAWRTATIADLSSGGAVTVLRSAPHRASESTEDRRPALTARDIATRSAATGSIPVQADAPAVELEIGDVLIPTIRSPHGEAFRIVGPGEVGIAVGPNIQVLRTNPGRLDPWFVAGFVSGSGDLATGVGTTAIRAGISRVRIPLLPIVEQHRYGELFRGMHQLRTALAQAGDAADQVVDVVTTGLIAGAVTPSPTNQTNHSVNDSRGGSA
ncbi:N-6 DNA methylase [Nocardia sp. NPDC056952]|uniref:N-6 DNA methylase n=1 Tax=Nocardia sp. NPDC056952 TaxID=3345979 RepID=UPI00362716BC